MKVDSEDVVVRRAALQALGGHKRAPQLGRTTTFDLVPRAGPLLHDPSIEPMSAHLHGSTGPASGFRLIWGFDPARGGRMAEQAEALLRMWIASWQDVADRTAVHWPWSPFSPGDIENALRIYQDRRLHRRFGTP